MPYGKAMEDFAFPEGAASYDYDPPKNRKFELERRKTKWGWSFGPPLAESKGGRSSKRMEYSFSGLLTAAERFMRFHLDPATGTPTSTARVAENISLDERREMAREVQRIAFEHLASRVVLHLIELPASEAARVKTLVLSGGVAANAFLRHVVRAMLTVRGFSNVELCCPPVELCTDNAAMIAWAGCEMWEAGWKSDLSIRPISKWPLDGGGVGEPSGVLGVEGWVRRD